MEINDGAIVIDRYDVERALLYKFSVIISIFSRGEGGLKNEGTRFLSFRRVIRPAIGLRGVVITRKQSRQLQVSLFAYQNYGNVVRLLWSCSMRGEGGREGGKVRPAYL